MKQYIKPNIEIVKARPYTLLDSSLPEGDQIENDFMGKEHNGWSFDEDDHDTNAWGDSFSAWD